MKIQINQFRQLAYRFLVILSVVSLLASCELFPSAVGFNSGGGESSPPAETNPPVGSEAAQTAPPSLPPMFGTPLLNPLDVPRSYVDDTCRYLRYKWNSVNAEPGTVAMIILVQSVTRGGVEQEDAVSAIELPNLIHQLREQGFVAITTRQLQAFMERNVRIPPRSVLIVQSGSHDAAFFEKIYGEYWDVWGWPVVNGWVSGPDLPDEMIQEHRRLEQAGFVDHQAGGVLPTARLSDESAKNVIARELQGSAIGLVNHFAKNPIAIIWPNGGFGIRPVEAARQLRFRLGVTQNGRGPLMYNWVPLADEFDPQRPAYIPEGKVNVPLMTLPSYSPSEAWAALDAVRAIGKEAAEYHLANRELEFEYYDLVCVPTHGPIPNR
jgi:hypothetical protein